MSAIEIPSFATIPELAEETGISENWFYQRSRLDKLPGALRFGRHLRVDQDEFYRALKNGDVK